MSTPEVVGPSNIEYRWPVETEPIDIYDDVVDRIEDGSFHSVRDREIARGIADDLLATVTKDPSRQKEFLKAAESLILLVPIMNSNGLREIAGKTVTPTLEARISSRLTSPEVDMTNFNSAWNRLPDKVQEAILNEDSLSVEMTAGCTVGCGFCVFAQEKGEISRKLSFNSIIEILSRYAEHHSNSKDFNLINLYYGSDPFDAKWPELDGSGERDYNDLVTAISPLFAEQRASLYTSTAVPLGEEMRVLNYALTQQSLNILTSLGLDNYLRFSKTKANAARVHEIGNILAFLRPRMAYRINNTSDYIAKRGSALQHAKDWRPWDASGPDCRDGVTIGVNSVDALYLLGASATNPNGSHRVPVETITVDESGYAHHLYRWPREYNASTSHKEPFTDFYPPTVENLYELVYDDKGNLVERTLHSIRMLSDPYRNLARLAAAHFQFNEARMNKGYNITYRDEVQYFLNDAKILEAFLQEVRASGKDDPIIDWLLSEPFPTDPPKSARELLAEHDS